jgi:hypothetical protein
MKSIYKYFALALFLLSGTYWAITLIAQCAYFAKSGEWVALPAKMIFYIGYWPDQPNFSPIHLVPQNLMPWAWIENPRDWIGLHKFVNWLLENISVGFLAFILGFLVMVASEEIEKESLAENPQKTS